MRGVAAVSMSTAQRTSAAQIHARLRSLDELVRRGDGVSQMGWVEQQEPGRFCAAIDHHKPPFHEFVKHVLRHGPIAKAVQVGSGGVIRHAVLRCFADRVVTIEPDAAEADKLRAQPLDPACDLVLTGDLRDAAFLAEAGAAASGCDLLLLDRDTGYGELMHLWRRFAPHVRPGGLVALVDRSQETPEVRRDDDIDRFIADLEQRYLAARGRPLHRFGAGHAIFVYERADSDDESEGTHWPSPTAAAPEWRRVPSPEGFTAFFGPGGWRAVVGSASGYSERRRARHQFELVLAADSASELEQRMAAWQRISALANAAQAQVIAGDRARFAACAAEAAHVGADVDAWLTDLLVIQPHSRPLLRTLGIWFCLRGDLDLGTALLTRLVGEARADGAAVQLLAQVHLVLRRDESAARDLLLALKRRVALQERRCVCLEAVAEHSLWGQPGLLGLKTRMLWIGSGGGPASSVCARLGMQMTWLPNGNPLAAVAPGTRIVPQVVAGREGSAQLFADPIDAGVCLRPWTEQFAAQTGGARQVSLGERTTTTLDQLLRSGQLDGATAEVVVVDVPGEEAAILRAAAELLRHAQVLCIAVHHPAVFVDTSPHQELLRWLETLGFAYTGAEATPIGHRAFNFLERVA